jgi:hypothetical protein
VIELDEKGRALGKRWGATAVVVGFTFLQAYGVMLALGVLRHDVNPATPALGFWATWTVLWAVKAILAILAKLWPKGES